MLKGSFRFSKEKLTNIFVFLGLLFAMVRMIRKIDNLYVLALLSFCGIFFLNYKKLYEPDFKKILIWLLPFGVWASLTAIWSLEPVISFSRGLFYIFISSTSVLIGYIYKNKTRDLFKQFLILNGLIIFISFLSLISGIPSDAWTANHGMGFTSIFTHQNTLAAVLMFTLIGPVYFLLNACPTSLERGIPKFMLSGVEACFKRESILLGLLILANLFFIYLSYSRAVMLALFVGGVLLVYLTGTIKTNLIFTLFLIISGASVFHFFGNNINSYLKKGGSDYFARRNILWEPSYKAALNGGIIGLGYGVTDPTINSTYKKENRFGELKREKGNSILAIVEETGIIGLILFLLPSGFILKNSTKKIFQARKFRILNFEFLIGFSFLIAFLIHAQFEAWMVGVSSFYLFDFFMFTSLLFE